MAIDTRQKRFSIMNMSCPWRQLAVNPPDLSSTGKYFARLYLYSGITSFVNLRYIVVYMWKRTA